MIPFPPFEPDRTRYAVAASTRAINCLPVRDGWGPKPDIVAISDALAAPCLGAVYVRTSAGAYDLIAGTATNLYRLNASDYSWTDISGASAPYAVPAGDRWSFLTWGQKLIACNLGTDDQVYDIEGGGVFADLAGSPPRSRYIWSAGDFVVKGYIANQPQRVQWSQIGNAEGWEVGLSGSDFQDMPDGEEVMGGIGSETGAIIFQRRKIRAMEVQPDIDFTFRIGVVNPDRGVVAPLSIVPIGPGRFAYLSEDGFFAGAEGLAIGAERVDRWFFSETDSTFFESVRGVSDPYRKIAWWQSERSDGTRFLVGWNWQLDRWCYAENNVGEMFVAASPATTWDGLDDQYATIDDADIPFDSRLLQGGRPEFVAFTTDDRLGFFSGAAMAATLETADVELNAGRRSYLQEARVYTNATDFTLQVGTSVRHGGTVTWGSAVSPYSETGICHFRSAALLHRFRMNIAAGADWDHVMGLDARSRPEGRR